MNPKRLAAVSVFSFMVTLTGCAGPGSLFGVGGFEVVEADNRFNPRGETLITSKNNRISKKSVAGGIHIDSSGVFINPSVIRSKEGHALSVSLFVVNHTNYDSNLGSPNALGRPQRISFLINGNKLINLNINHAENNRGETRYYNSGTGSVSASIMESGDARLTTSQYKEIMQAQTLVVKLVGTKRSVTYEAHEISPSFQENLSRFYQQNL